MCDQRSLRSACAYAQSDQSFYKSLEYSMIVELLTEYQLEFLSLKGGCTGSSESTLVKIPLYWKFRVAAYMYSCVDPARLRTRLPRKCFLISTGVSRFLKLESYPACIQCRITICLPAELPGGPMVAHFVY